MKKRVLIVDDSAFMRKVLTDQVSKVKGCMVAGTARSGEDALRKFDQLQLDAIILDIVLPGMSGLETIKHIRKKSDIPVFMISSLQGKDITLQSLEAGATDFIQRPKSILENVSDFQEKIACKLALLFDEKETTTNLPKPKALAEILTQRKQAIVIAASTGGPSALLKLVRELPSDLAIPIFIVQHMPEGFTTSFAKRLNEHAQVRVKEAQHGEKIVAGMVYLAPGDFHMTIGSDRILLNRDEKLHAVRPAADYLFESAAKVYGKDLMAVILTGMGRDGTRGMKAVKKMGGSTLAQSQDTCVVYGMPGNAMRAGVVDVCADLEDLGKIINEVTKVSK